MKMGSLEEEEKLIQMVNEFIESDNSPTSHYSASSKCLLLKNQTQIFTLQEILGSGKTTEAEVLESVVKHMRKKKDVLNTNSLRKYLVKRLRMDDYRASLCQTSWVTSLGCPAGYYEYIDIMVQKEDGDTIRLIVDIDLKSQFELARPTKAYKQLIDTIPQIFVGTEGKLIKIITLLCSAAKQSLKEKRLYVPPWRTTTYMQSKWFSTSQKETTSVVKEVGFGKDNREHKIGARGFNKWAPPTIMPKRKEMNGGSGLSNQFSDMGINCC